MRKIDEIIVHCTATRPDWFAGKSAQAKVNEVRRWHLDRGWSDIGYHYLIDRDGTVVEGRPVERTGAHVKGHNTGTIGVALLGGLGGSAGDSFADHFTQEQDDALRALIADLQVEHMGIRKISGHNQYAAKACPCFSVPAWLKEAPAPKMKPPVADEKPRALAQSRTMRASAVQAATAFGGAVTAIQALDGLAQIIVAGGAVLIVIMALWIMRERMKKWADGIR